jgi:hypothetical protein
MWDNLSVILYMQWTHEVRMKRIAKNQLLEGSSRKQG